MVIAIHALSMRRTLQHACDGAQTYGGSSSYALRCKGSCKQPERTCHVSPSAKSFLLIALFAMGWGADAHAAQRTVCTITVNSSNEKEMFRQRLPENQYQFVELVERGRSDWLASACRQGIHCDVLVISGHFDGNTEFYSDQTSARSFCRSSRWSAPLRDSCPGLFSQLKEVYLFGCNTLNADAIKRISSEVGRTPCPPGHAAEAERLARLDQRHGESSRDRMRRIFINVPVIYGFSSVAALGPTRRRSLPLFATIVDCGGRQRSYQFQAPQLLCHECMVAVSGERFGSARWLSA
jgi:hypothetical protein